MRRTLHKAITLLLTLALFLSLSVPALAAGEQFDFTLTANGKQEVTIALGTRAKIMLTVVNENIGDGQTYDLYTLQDYICYDRSFFDIDESSISVKKISGSDLFTATAVCFDGGDPDRVYVHRSATTGQRADKSIDVVSFDLIAKKVGTSHIMHDTIEMTSAGLQRLTCAASDATVNVGARSNRITASAGVGGTISPSGDVDVVEGEDQTFAIAANSGYEIKDVVADGSSVGVRTSYTFTNVRETHTIAAFFQTTGGGAGGGISGGGAVPAPAAGTAVPVIVDGNSYDIGTVQVSGDITTVAVDHAALDAQIATAHEYVKVPVAADTNTVAAQFVVYNVEKMSDKNMTLIVDLDSVDYIIPAVAVNTAALDAAFPGVSTADIPFVVTIADTPQARNSAVSGAVTTAGGQLVLPAMDFTVTAQYGGKSVEVEVFENYTARVVEITAEQAQRITTAVVYEPDGSLRHVPTDVYQEGGKWYARVNSLTNSTYALIYNQASLSDTAGTWYGDVVDEMVSRKIVNGYADGTYMGAKNVTRAEFAAIIVRALGLSANGTASFSDTPAGAWYHGTVGTATRYGIVNGYTDGTFKPYKMITRQEAMAMVARAAKVAELTGVSGGDLSAFADADKVGAWAKPAVEFNVANGLIRGNGGYLKPNDNITRAETAVVVLRLLQRAGLVDVRAKA